MGLGCRKADGAEGPLEQQKFGADQRKVGDINGKKPTQQPKPLLTWLWSQGQSVALQKGQLHARKKDIWVWK